MDSTHHERFCGVPEFFQVREHPVSPESSKARHILNDCENWSDFADEARVLEPKPASLSFKTSTFAGRGDVLAGKSTADGIHGNSICFKTICREFSHVTVAGNIGPPSGENCLAERLSFTERDGSEAGPLETEAETANSGEEIEDIQI